MIFGALLNFGKICCPCYIFPCQIPMSLFYCSVGYVMISGIEVWCPMKTSRCQMFSLNPLKPMWWPIASTVPGLRLCWLHGEWGIKNIIWNDKIQALILYLYISNTLRKRNYYESGLLSLQNQGQNSRQSLGRAKKTLHTMEYIAFQKMHDGLAIDTLAQWRI